MTFIPNHDGRGTYFIDATWLSNPPEPDDDLPEEFTLEDMEALNMPPDYEHAARVERYYERLRKMISGEKWWKFED